MDALADAVGVVPLCQFGRSPAKMGTCTVKLSRGEIGESARNRLTLGFGADGNNRVTIDNAIGGPPDLQRNRDAPAQFVGTRKVRRRAI